ncbi:15086_t:CDS:2 [Cetraspora pellucida]|uniref:Ribonuclease P/MRP protein subunit POP5 n=1 Tax=Cetraspora pellucida TaxID=1433469 RepID=A0A9N9CQS3_9GLOM|nr:15086_t:CDS:2 [Cetraspora pellucida]
MVRLKHRWILFETLFEDTSQQDTSVDSLTSHDIFTTVKESIQLNFGDYGRGCVSSSLNGTIKQCQTLIIEYDKEQILENEELDDT